MLNRQVLARKGYIIFIFLPPLRLNSLDHLIYLNIITFNPRALEGKKKKLILIIPELSVVFFIIKLQIQFDHSCIE